MRITPILAVGFALLMSLSVHAQAPRLTHLRDIGCADCGGPAQFAEINDVALRETGELVVLGNDAPLLRSFDLSGRPLWSAARSGQGPGEFQRALWLAVGDSVIQVVDMSQRRITRLDARGQFRSAVPLPGFPASASPQVRTGAVAVVIDDFRGGRVLHRWTPLDSGTVVGAIDRGADAAAPGAIMFASVAVARSGEMAVAPDGSVYHIDRLGADGRVLGTITRDIPRVRRTPEELDAMAQTARRAADRAGAERGRSNVPPPILPRPGGGADFKPHIATNGLRYDGAGRLWVRTMRGDATSTVFDVFTPAGAFLGEVKVDAAVSAYAFGGRWMAAAIVTEEGYAIVRVFEVR